MTEPKSLNRREAETLLEQVADATAAGLPLAAGLRAAAAESSSRRLTAELGRIAGELEHGRALDEVLAERSDRYAGCLGGLVRAGVRSGNLGVVLLELVDHQRRLRDLTQSLRSALAYPALLVALALVIGVYLDRAFIGPMLQMYQEFKLKLPWATQVVGWLHSSGLGWLALAGLALVVGGVVFRLLAGAARWQRAWATLPLLGALWHWSGVAEWARLLASLLEQEVPLPEALQLAAGGLRDANLGELSGHWATRVQQGQSLTELLATTHRLPASLGPVVGWGERSGRLVEALRVAADMFEGRVRLRAELLKSILPFVVFVTIALAAVFALAAVYLPMLSMIQGLS